MYVGCHVLSSYYLTIFSSLQVSFDPSAANDALLPRGCVREATSYAPVTTLSFSRSPRRKGASTKTGFFAGVAVLFCTFGRLTGH